MVNPSKAKGTAAETAVVKYMRAHGYPGADRQPLRGDRDAGDIALCPGVILEIKSHKTAGLGQPGHTQLASWMAQAETERVNASALMCPLVVKRTGTTDVGMWWAYVTAEVLASLLDAPTSEVERLAPICMSVGSLVAFLRSNGYGTPMEVAS